MIINDKTMQLRAREILRAHQAAENVRQQQQGHGKSIISAQHGEYRIVLVGSTAHWGKNWLVFADFLFHFLKQFGITPTEYMSMKKAE